MKVALGSANTEKDILALRQVFDDRDFGDVEIVCVTIESVSAPTKEGQAQERAQLAKQEYPDANLFVGIDHVDEDAFTLTHVSVLPMKGDYAIGCSISHSADKDSRHFDVKTALASSLFQLLDSDTYPVR